MKLHGGLVIRKDDVEVKAGHSRAQNGQCYEDPANDRGEYLHTLFSRGDGCGGRNRTSDLRAMTPARYRLHYPAVLGGPYAGTMRLV